MRAESRTRQQRSKARIGSNSTDIEPKEVDFDVINSVFSLRKPKDFKAGLASGSKSIVKGILAGTVSLVAAPAVGAVSEGWGGFAKGVGFGVAGAVILPVTGVGIGVTQAIRGAINTPAAIREALKGKHWDQDKRLWIDNPTLALILDDDEVFGSARQRWHSDPNNQPSTSGRIDAEDLYELLGVPRNATPEQIKRQYYIMARKMHPDKNPHDPQAKERFQRLGEAYQVLGTAELRERYDKHGAQALDVDFMDASEFFTMLFGSDKFEHLVGELMIAAAARNGGDFTFAEIKKLQAGRIDQLAVMLQALLRRWVEGDQDGFKESTEAEGRMLASTLFGAKILRTLGKTYELQAEIFSGGLIDGTVAGVRSRMHTMRTQMSAASMAIKVFQTQQEMERFERDSKAAKAKSDLASGRAPKSQKTSEEQQDVHAPADEAQPLQQSPEAAAERQRLEEAALPIMLDAMWAANVLDIESTARGVCKKTLGDQSVDKRVRKSRAAALKFMGRTFQKCADEVLQKQEPPIKAEQPRLAKQQMEEAMQRLVAKRHAMDDALYKTSSSI